MDNDKVYRQEIERVDLGDGLALVTVVDWTKKLGSIEAPKGSIIVCPNGHEIAELVEDLHVADMDWSAKIGNWRQTQPEIGTVDPKCDICGEPWYTYEKALTFKT